MFLFVEYLYSRFKCLGWLVSKVFGTAGAGAGTGSKSGRKQLQIIPWRALAAATRAKRITPYSDSDTGFAHFANNNFNTPTNPNNNNMGGERIANNHEGGTGTRSPPRPMANPQRLEEHPIVEHGAECVLTNNKNLDRPSVSQPNSASFIDDSNIASRGGYQSCPLDSGLACEDESMLSGARIDLSPRTHGFNNNTTLNRYSIPIPEGGAESRSNCGGGRTESDNQGFISITESEWYRS